MYARYCYILYHRTCGSSQLKPLDEIAVSDGRTVVVFLCLHCNTRFALGYTDLDAKQSGDGDTHGNGKVIPFPKPVKE